MSKKAYTLLFISILVITFGIYCTVDLCKMFDVQSNEYGTVFAYKVTNNYTEFSRFDYGYIDFESSNRLDYVNVSNYAAQKYDGTQDTYYLYFNNQPLKDVQQIAGALSGTLQLNFYNSYGVVISTANLHFKVEYLANTTRVTATIQNLANSVSYLNTYMEINGAVLRVVKAV